MFPVSLVPLTEEVAAIPLEEVSQLSSRSDVYLEYQGTKSDKQISRYFNQLEADDKQAREFSQSSRRIRSSLRSRRTEEDIDNYRRKIRKERKLEALRVKNLAAERKRKRMCAADFECLA